jgi:hypothetical protein
MVEDLTGPLVRGRSRREASRRDRQDDRVPERVGVDPFVQSPSHVRSNATFRGHSDRDPELHPSLFTSRKRTGVPAGDRELVVCGHYVCMRRPQRTIDVGQVAAGRGHLVAVHLRLSIAPPAHALRTPMHVPVGGMA